MIKEDNMTFQELILKRRSIRHYSSQPVDHAVLEEILKEARLAPSWKNSQTDRCYVVE